MNSPTRALVRALTLGVLLVLAGCATTAGRGQSALYAGRYDDAVARFQEALADKPDDVTARVGLGESPRTAGGPPLPRPHRHPARTGRHGSPRTSSGRCARSAAGR